MADSGTVVSASSDATVKVWNTQAAEQEQPVRHHFDLVSAVALDPNGQWAITISPSRPEAKTWWIRDNRDYVEQPPSGKFFDLEVLSGGRVVLASSSGCIVWQTESGREIQRFAQGIWICKLASSEDGKFIVGGDVYGHLIIWETLGWREVQKVRVTGREIGCIAVAPDGRWVAFAASGEKMPTMWNISDGRMMQFPAGHSMAINALQVTQNGRYLVSAGGDRTLICWDLTTQQRAFALQGHTDEVEDVAITPNGRFIISGSRDKQICIWNFHTQEIVGRFVCTSDVQAVALHDNLLGVGCHSGHVYILELNGLEYGPGNK
jgi:WD40 repeat protein